MVNKSNFLEGEKMKNKLKKLQRKLRKLSWDNTPYEWIELSIMVRRINYQVNGANFTKDLNRLLRVSDKKGKRAALLAKKLDSKVYLGK